MNRHTSEDHVKTSGRYMGHSCKGRKSRMGQSGDMLPLPLCLSVCVSLPPAPQPRKVHAITCGVQSIPLYKHTVYKTDRKVFCMRQEKLLREILWLHLCGSGLVIITVSSVFQMSERDSWATEVTVSGFGAAWGAHCVNSCSLMKMWGYKSRILKYRCTWPGNIVERQKVRFGSFILGETAILP